MNTKLSSHSEPQERCTAGTFTRLRAILGFALLAVGCLAVLLACAPAYTRPLASRGLPAEERKDYIIQNGYGISENIKQAFLEGFVEVDMAKELVFQLYGTPDRTTGGDVNWEYVNNKGSLITGVTFKADKVEKVYGDPKGGSTTQAQTTP
ncbi:MAG: hypothetical protein M3Y08_05040 [Fibrobacterota bacterium]|nr:hypothetical protein [Fibrobacterota bacterium]